jgi:hypothetical protein
MYVRKMMRIMFFLNMMLCIVNAKQYLRNETMIVGLRNCDKCRDECVRVFADRFCQKCRVECGI